MPSSPEYMRAWREANPDKLAEYKSRSSEGYFRRKAGIPYTRDPPKLGRYKVRTWRLKHKYGITRAQYEEMFTSQGNKCAACPATEPGKSDWHIDHCHKTGRVRGVLCRDCNIALGFARDNPTTLRNLADYLEKQEEKAVSNGPEAQ